MIVTCQSKKHIYVSNFDVKKTQTIESNHRTKQKKSVEKQECLLLFTDSGFDIGGNGTDFFLHPAEMALMGKVIVLCCHLLVFDCSAKEKI